MRNSFTKYSNFLNVNKNLKQLKHKPFSRSLDIRDFSKFYFKHLSIYKLRSEEPGTPSTHRGSRLKPLTLIIELSAQTRGILENLKQ